MSKDLPTRLPGPTRHSALRRPNHFIGSVARAYVLTAIRNAPDFPQLNGTGESILDRVDRLAGETYSVLTLRFPRSKTDPNQGTFTAELFLDWGVTKNGENVLRARSEPIDGFRIGDVVFTFKSDLIPEARLNTYKARSRQTGLAIGDIFTTGLAGIDTLKLQPYPEEPSRSIVPPENISFLIAQENTQIDDFCTEAEALVKSTSPQMSDEQLERIVERLEGQCQISIAQALEEEGLPREGNEERIEERVFECTRCGWTISTDEQCLYQDELICEQCEEEIKEEEEV